MKFIECCKNNSQHLQSSDALLDAWKFYGRQVFLDQEFPHCKQELWKYTDLTELQNLEFKAAKKTEKLEVAEYFLPGCMLLVFINGFFVKKLSDLKALPKGVELRDVDEYWRRHSKFLTERPYIDEDPGYFNLLNASLFHGGLFLYVPKDVVLDRPIQLLNIIVDSRQSMHNLRHVIVLEKGAQVNLIETQHGGEECFNNCVTQVYVSKKAVFNYNKLQQAGLSTWNFANLIIKQQAGSVVTTNCTNFGGRLAREDIKVKLLGENAQVDMSGVYLARGKQHLDTRTYVEHVAPNCSSNELYKGIAGDNAHAVFNGKIIVKEGARQTVGHLVNKNLLLSEQAEIDTKPELEIYTDDVKCNHGATVGQLQQSAIFYLQSRGIPLQQAKLMLTQAFAGEVLNKITIEDLGVKIAAEFQQALGQLCLC